MFKAPFSFNGRIRRLEFGLSYIIFYAYIFLGVMIIQLLAPHSIGADETIPQILSLLLMIPGYWFLLAQGAKRCHDRSNSGWFQIIPFYVFWMLFAEGFPGPNEYGLNPKEIGNYDEISQIGAELEQQ